MERAVGKIAMVSPRKLGPARSAIDGTGVFATRPLEKGEFIGYLSGQRCESPTNMSVQIGPVYHVDPYPQGVLRHLNHSCIPTAYFRGRRLYSVRAVLPTEEVTIDYNCTEAELAVPFSCACGQEICVKEVRGWRALNVNQRHARIRLAQSWLTEEPLRPTDDPTEQPPRLRTSPKSLLLRQGRTRSRTGSPDPRDTEP